MQLTLIIVGVYYLIGLIWIVRNFVHTCQDCKTYKLKTLPEEIGWIRTILALLLFGWLWPLDIIFK